MLLSHHPHHLTLLGNQGSVPWYWVNSAKSWSSKPKDSTIMLDYGLLKLNLRLNPPKDRLFPGTGLGPKDVSTDTPPVAKGHCIVKTSLLRHHLCWYARPLAKLAKGSMLLPISCLYLTGRQETPPLSLGLQGSTPCLIRDYAYIWLEQGIIQGLRQKKLDYALECLGLCLNTLEIMILALPEPWLCQDMGWPLAERQKNALDIGIIHLFWTNILDLWLWTCLTSQSMP